MCGEDTLLQPWVKEHNHFAIFLSARNNTQSQNMKVPLSKEGFFFFFLIIKYLFKNLNSNKSLTELACHKGDTETCHPHDLTAVPKLEVSDDH